jgi:hypothetical protein
MNGKCPNCGTTVAADAPKCGACGADFSPRSAWKPIIAGAGKPHSNGSGWTTADVLGILIPTFGVLAWVVALIGAANQSLTILGSLELFRSRLGMTIRGVPYFLAWGALAMAAVAVFGLKTKHVPWFGIAFGSALILFAHSGFR